MNLLPLTEADLQAYVDDQLPQERRREIEAYLTTRPEEAERLQSYAAQKREIRALFDPVLDEAVPSRLVETAAKRRPWYLQRIAAGVAIALVSGAAGWGLHGQGGGPSSLAQRSTTTSAVNVAENGLAHRAALAHAVYSPDMRRPVEIGADQEDQLVAWLSKRMGAKMRPPRLADLDYQLIGGRLLPGDQGPVAQFMYQDASGERLTLYVSAENTSNRDTAFRFAQEGSINVFYWIDGPFGYAISGSADKAALARISTAVYDQLQSR